MNELTISLDTRSRIPLYEQIYDYIKTDIQSGRIPYGEKLPSTRFLSKHLEVSRSTVELAYEQLLSEGYIESVPYKGFFVAQIDELYHLKKDKPQPQRERKEARRYRYDFTPNGVDLKSFPYNVWRKLSKDILLDDRTELFRSGDSQGEYGFRSAICSYLYQARGVDCTPDQIIVGAGSDYILMLLGMILGSLAAMRENHIKRMLAYSSVAQVGYIFMGVGLGSIEGLIASFFHILVHACCKPLLFLCAGRLSAVSGHHKSLKNLRGSAYRDIGAGLGFTVGALSMIGIPLFGGFVSKLYFASASLPTNRTAVTLLTIALSTVLNALYYIPALLSIWMRPDPADERAVLADATPEMLAFDRPFTAAAAVFTASIFILGIFYHPITDIIEAGIRLI